jgi:hypothetical protein
MDNPEFSVKRTNAAPVSITQQDLIHAFGNWVDNHYKNCKNQIVLDVNEGERFYVIVPWTNRCEK